MADFSIKRNDRLPRLRATLTVTGGGALDLTGATSVTFRMKLETSTAWKVSAPATVIDPTAGIVEYAWAAGDCDTLGAFKAEWVIDYLGFRQTVPSGSEMRVQVNPSLADLPLVPVVSPRPR